jgi:hypothetical protein
MLCEIFKKLRRYCPSNPETWAENERSVTAFGAPTQRSTNVDKIPILGLSAHVRSEGSMCWKRVQISDGRIFPVVIENSLREAEKGHDKAWDVYRTGHTGPGSFGLVEKEKTRLPSKAP